MSGHSHWAGIKHQKEITDKKRAKIFSKLLVAISVAARKEPDPNFNPRLRTAVQKAREASVPADNIDRAIKKTSDPSGALEELLFEAYGPGGAALLISAISDKSNRTVQEVKNVLNENCGKWAEPGSVKWAFEPARGGESWTAKFPLSLSKEDKEKLENLISALEDLDDVQEVFTNTDQRSILYGV